MIEVSANTAMMLYLSLTLAVILGIWIQQHYASKKRQLSIQENTLFICEYCHFAYLASKHKKINKCPQCHSFNQQNLH